MSEAQALPVRPGHRGRRHRRRRPGAAARRAGPPRPAPARDHRAGLLRGPHARADRRAHRPAARHGQDPTSGAPWSACGPGWRWTVQHCTPEQLALAALREPLPDADAAHLAACERCRAEVASLQRAVDALAVPAARRAGRVRRPAAARLGGDRRRDRRHRHAAARAGRRVGPPAPAPSQVVGRPSPRAAGRTAGRPGPSCRSGPGAARCCSSPPPRWPARRSAPVPSRCCATATEPASAVARRSRRSTSTRWPTTTPPGAPRWSSGRTARACWRSSCSAGDLDDGYYEVWLIDEAVVGHGAGGRRPRRARSPSSCPRDLDLGRVPDRRRLGGAAGRRPDALRASRSPAASWTPEAARSP